jgi:hypothetical protein
MLTWLLDRIRGEWAMITSTPIIFLSTWIIAGIIIWYLIRSYYSERIKIANETNQILRNRLEAEGGKNQSHSSNRSLTPLQKCILASEFEALGKDFSASVYAYPGVDDAKVLQDQFNLLFVQAGWNVTFDTGIMPSTKYSTGIWLIGNPGNKEFYDLKSALTKSEIKFRTDNDNAGFEPYIIIGAREPD